MYIALQTYLASLATQHIELTTALLSHQLTHANKYEGLTGSVLQVDPLSGSLSGDLGDTMDLTLYLTLAVNTNFNGKDDHNKLSEGYHPALAASHKIILQLIAKMEYDIEQDDCPVTDILFNQIKITEGEPVALNWATVIATIPYTVQDVINYEPTLWE